jgi:DNA-binding transcriptional ArsR family regulator
MTSSTHDDAPFAFAGLDRLFHERARLGIVTSLAGSVEGLAFSELKRLCGLTDGNLSRHLAALEEADYVNLSKDQGKGRPVTLCRLTRLGRERFISYLGVLEEVLKQGTRATAPAKVERMSGQEA